jgi:iron complex transport system ATP-binding protein
LSRCDALQFATRRMDELSAGERARILLARALATRAPILLVDEPAAHLDPAHQLQLMELLREEAARGAAVVVTLHDLSLASRFCDELVVLKSGRVTAQGAPETSLSEATLAEIFGVSAVRMTGAIIPWQRL